MMRDRGEQCRNRSWPGFQALLAGRFTKCRELFALRVRPAIERFFLDWIGGTKMFKQSGLAIFFIFFCAASACAGDGYEVTAQQGGKQVTYMVNFGGGKLFDQHTAFDPESKKFVYLSWKRDAEPPKPVMTIWDHKTGELIPLYKFPDVKNPLPVIPSIEAMKVCPLTGDKEFKAKLVMAID